MSAHVLLSLLNELGGGKRSNAELVEHVLFTFRNELINSIIKDNEC